MKRFYTYLLASALVFGMMSCEKDKADDVNEAQQTVLSDAQKNNLAELYNEEKLAHDIYQQFYLQHNYTPFSHITAAEEYHMSRVAEVMVSYKLTVPQLAPGVFDIVKFQTAYDEWLPKGLADGQEACMIAAYIEEMDILDLLHAINNIAEADDIEAMYQELMSGSENHLRAYNRFLDMQFGVDYQPQLMDQAMFDAIIAASGNHGGSK